MTGKIELSIPLEMIPFIPTDDSEMELLQRAMMLYPYIQNETISHGKAAAILGIGKIELIGIYSRLGISYLDIDNCDLDKEVAVYNRIKENRR